MQNFLNEIDKDITHVLDNLPVGIIRLNSELKCVYANKFIMRILGISGLGELCGDILNDKDGKDTNFGIRFHPDDRESEMQANTQFLFARKECETLCRLYNYEVGDYRWVTNKRIILESNENLQQHNGVSYMYTIQDVHDIKNMEVQLRQETLRAEEAGNHKSMFLANMSHEIRTPLNGIVGMLTLLEDTSLSNDQQDYISMVKECSFNLMTIINDILDFSKLEAGKILLNPTSMSLRDCIESTNDIIMSKVHERALEYSFDIAPDIPQYIVADINRLKQIILNLLSNSIKFTERGGIFLFVEVVDNNDMASDCLCLQFNVSDTGCGIENGDKTQLFKSFTQLSNRVTNKIFEGTGLGLAISKELVELMGGSIWLDWSQVGKGSKFSFTIPVKKSTEIIPRTDTLDEDVLKDANVLILDDNLQNRLSLAGLVTKWGMKPHTYSNGDEALYFSRMMSFDIGLIDVCMPKVDGAQFANRLREGNELNAKLPLIALSSLGDKTYNLSKHFSTHLVKPVKENKLKTSCIALLSKRKGHALPVPTPKSIETYLLQNHLQELKSNVRILVAEDVFINQRVISSFLTKLGYNEKNITMVDNGQKCMDQVKIGDFDVILLDIRMPVKSGDVVMQEISQFYSDPSNFHRNKPYMVAVTAYCQREDKDKYINMGFDNYIPKPITLNDLAICLDGFLQAAMET
jgi:signal transduction histidine kinase/CheY-like chemotaxis protein